MESKVKKYTRVYADINLDNIEYNVSALMALTKPGTKAMAVVKADAYGHGDVAVAKAVNDIVDAYAVATVEEGINLRQNGIEKMILVLGYVDEMHYDQVIRYALSIPVFDTEMAKKMSAAAVAAGENIRCHVKVDTGMHRIGLRPDDDGIKTVLALAKYDGLDVEGIFTHFATADERIRQQHTGSLNFLKLLLKSLRMKACILNTDTVLTVRVLLICLMLIWIWCVLELQCMECIRLKRSAMMWLN